MAVDLARADAVPHVRPRLPFGQRVALPDGLVPLLQRIGWMLISVGCFAGLWELLWALGIADAKLLPPPHIFLGNLAEQARFFNTAQRWQIGTGMNAGPSPAMAVLITVLASTGRVLAGLALAATLSILVGVAIRYVVLFERLTLPTITLLAPVSPIAWLPVAIFMFGIGNAPAIFMVFIALFFTMVLSTIHQIDGVNRNYINVARTMGATKRQIYARVIVPAILPGLLAVLRLNLFGAWMVVLVAEATGVGYGLGQVIMLARNTFNPSLVFFTITLIGLLGFAFDLLFRLVQRRMLYWLPRDAGSSLGL
ncbi:ABC transporter permease [Methylobacterium sp. PvR107]|uniref:ABC transporter permease n=1 Tax=Methylobacterium sp. PvR107 TaxID=2806597 RepID=UPI001AE8EDF2|nr:ABC transporter permease [Methylobacterium sp. PvR107]MBP1179359.1 NitT/TauT family transport system permease protein [Methylobacterium sp. PvR107]